MAELEMPRHQPCRLIDLSLAIEGVEQGGADRFRIGWVMGKDDRRLNPEALTLGTVADILDPGNYGDFLVERRGFELMAIGRCSCQGPGLRSEHAFYARLRDRRLRPRDAVERAFCGQRVRKGTPTTSSRSRGARGESQTTRVVSPRLRVRYASRLPTDRNHEFVSALSSLVDQAPTWASASSLARTWGLNQLTDRLAEKV
jgi:hypothetical protein